MLLKGSAEQIDDLIAQLYDRTVNSIKRVKDLESEEWGTIGRFIYGKEEEIHEIVSRNEKILAYYKSDSFMKIKETCEALMSTQREFNEYIMEKLIPSLIFLVREPCVTKLFMMMNTSTFAPIKRRSRLLLQKSLQLYLPVPKIILLTM